MATHTQSGEGSYGRKFSIGRENGQANKDGRPYFFEWIKEIPQEMKGRKFETRISSKGETRNYELFSALDGYLIDIRKEEKDLGNGAETWLIMHLIDADDEYTVEIGRLDSRYASDFLKRILNPAFSPTHKVRVSPYSVLDEKTGRYNIGLSTFSGVDKLTYSVESEFLKGIPHAESREWKGKTEWDFSGVAKWLFEQVQTLVVPKLLQDPISAPKEKQQAAEPPPGNAKAVDVPAGATAESDDLPF